MPQMLSESYKLNTPDVVAEINHLVLEWRTKAMDIMITILVLIALPPLFMVTFWQQLDWQWIARGAALVFFGILLMTVWRQKWSSLGRALVLFSALYGFTALQIMTTGLYGSGRIGLVILPIMALILVGSRVGWLCAGVSLIMFSGFNIAIATGLLTEKMMVGDGSTHQAFWLLQWLMLLGGLLPLMVLLTRFQSFQMKVMLNERHAHRRIQAIAAEQCRLENEITRISEQEKRRLGSELHDGLCQQLTAALLSATAIENDLATRGGKESQSSQRLRTMLEECIDTAYNVAKGLCPVDMNSESLLPALQRLGWQAKEYSGIECEVHEEGIKFQLDSGASLHLYRIAQEAVKNAIKHTHCRRIILELYGTIEYCILRVIDDGQAKVNDTKQSTGGMGIQIMQYRAKMAGGTLRIENPTCGGTVVSCFVPCSQLMENMTKA